MDQGISVVSYTHMPLMEHLLIDEIRHMIRHSGRVQESLVGETMLIQRVRSKLFLEQLSTLGMRERADIIARAVSEVSEEM